jgi:LDH2 family malate/lactate/ureidoglycolate dehydrogenase
MEPSSSDPNLIVEVDRSTLHQLIVKLLQRKGMFAAEAEIVAERMIEADLLQRFGEGTGTLPEYLEAMDLGDIDPRARVITVSESPAITVLDGSTGMGHIATTKAAAMAIEKANSMGICTVFVKNSRPCGDLGYIASLVAKQGLFGLVTTSFVEGGKDPLHNHDLAWSIPSPDQSAPRIHRQQSQNIDASLAMLCSVLSTGLSGAGASPRKRKAIRAANTVDYGIIAVSPDKVGTKEAFMAMCQSLSSTASDSSLNETTVPLKQADASQLAELAAKIKFAVSW